MAVKELTESCCLYALLCWFYCVGTYNLFQMVLKDKLNQLKELELQEMQLIDSKYTGIIIVLHIVPDKALFFFSRKTLTFFFLFFTIKMLVVVLIRSPLLRHF